MIRSMKRQGFDPKDKNNNIFGHKAPLNGTEVTIKEDV